MAATFNRIRRSKEHCFFFLASLAPFAFVVVGFFESYFRVGMLFAHLPSNLVHIHAGLFVGWIILFGAQISLVASGHVRWHRRLGVALGVWAALMVIVGPFTAVLAVRRGDSGLRPFEFLGDLSQVLVFGFLVGRGLLLRSDLLAHKRLMLIATSVLMLPALARFPSAVAMPAILALYLLIPLALVFWDLATLHRVHSATIIGLALVGLVLAATLGLGRTPMWLRITQWIANA